jgi:hypothetical protein
MNVIARNKAICALIFGVTAVRNTDCFIPRNDSSGAHLYYNIFRLCGIQY